MSQSEKDELVVTERVALILWRIANGEQFTTSQVADVVSLSHDAAWRMMTKISRRWPITQIDGIWTLIR